MITLKNKIFDELRRLHIEANGLWRFQNWNVFYRELNPLERKEFENVISELLNDGVLIAEQYGSVYNYRLTQKGEETIYCTIV